MNEQQKDDLYKEQEYLLFHEKFDWFIGKIESKDKEIQSLTEQLQKNYQNGHDEGYGKGYSDATKEACEEINKNYHPNK